MTGVVGHIMWHYHVAAIINGYRVTRQGEAFTLDATVVLPNPFNLTQRPLIFVAKYKTPQGDTGEWRWPIESMEPKHIVGPSQIRATLGSPL